ncbi:MAG: ABC transporter substrate-binding protein [Candidatus Limnocylindrales bacterium]
MRNSRVFAIGATLIMILAACTSGSTPAPSAAASAAPSQAAASASAAATPAASVTLPTVRIGSDNFYESKLMAEIYAQILEHAGYTVERHFGLGSRQAREPLLEQGQVDMVPEYIGSGLGYYDKTAPTGDAQSNHDKLAAILKTKGGGIEVFGFTPAQDQNAAVVRKDTATQYSLTKMSDLAAVQTKLKWGLPPDCDTNPLCSGALKQYGITYPPAQRVALAACDAPIAQALQAKTIDFAWLCSTQPAILQFGFVQLTDDLKTQPADNIAPLVRDDFLAKVPDKAAFQALLDNASAKMTTAMLLQLGVDIAVNNQDIATVAKNWLTQEGLLK